MDESPTTERKFAESLDSHEELQKFDTYTDEVYAIVRTSDHANVRLKDDVDYEFVLYVEGEPVVNAGTLEAQGWSKPWVPALTRYAKAFIDGAYSGLEPRN